MILPLACLISVALNIVRLALLIIIGAELSPSIAVGGFHINAGWIASVLVALLIVFVFSTWPWIQKKSQTSLTTERVTNDSGLAMAILIPFVVFASMSLVSGVVIDQFDYLNPFKVILVFGSVLYFWNHYQFQRPEKLSESFFVGVVVAALWAL